MSIGSIGSAALNSVLQTAAKIQAIDRDPSISSEAKRRMTAELGKANGSLMEGAELDDEAANRSTLLDSAAAPAADVTTGAVAASAGSVSPQPSAPGIVEPRGLSRSEPLSRGMTIDKVG